MDNLPLKNDIFDHINEGVYILNRQGDYIYCNQAFLKMVGATREEALSLNAFQLIPEGQVSSSVAVQAFEQKKRLTIINNVVTPKGYHYRQLATATPIFDGQGEIVYMLVEMVRLDLFRRRYQQAILQENENTIVVIDPDAKPENQKECVIAESVPMVRVLEMAAQVAATDSTVLLLGDTGTGKEVLAHYIHEHSSRASRPLVEVNCAALPENLLEMEIFGYEKGAFTGALSTGKEGLIEAADGGILFLDEINSMPMSIQGKLLRVLESRKSKRLGAVKERKIDFRLLAATNQDLKLCVENGTFRSDLYYRINVVPLEIPRLRDRREDIIPLALYFLELYCQKYGRLKTLTRRAMEQLRQYDWPGNVRELKNAMERLVVTSASGVTEIDQIPEFLLTEAHSPEETRMEPEVPDWRSTSLLDSDGFSLKRYLEDCEKKVLSEVLKTCGSTHKAAKFLKMDQSTIVRKKQKYGL